MKREDLHIRDPFVLVHGGAYYLLGTTGDDCWNAGSNLKLFKSADLETFEEHCTMVSPELLKGYTNIWAPELHEYNGKFYLVFSVFCKEKGRGSIIFCSDGLNSGFKPLTGEYITPEGWGCLDATLFVYGGKPYLCFSNEWTTPITGDGDGSLFIAELSKDLKKLVEKPRKIISGKYSGFATEINIDNKIFGYVAEGPYLYEENGGVVLLWSTYTKTGYSVIKSVSKNGIYGEYVYEKKIFEKDGGHCMRFLSLKGKPLIALHQPNFSPEERMKIIEESL